MNGLVFEELAKHVSSQTLEPRLCYFKRLISNCVRPCRLCYDAGIRNLSPISSKINMFSSKIRKRYRTKYRSQLSSPQESLCSLHQSWSVACYSYYPNSHVTSVSVCVACTCSAVDSCAWCNSTLTITTRTGVAANRLYNLIPVVFIVRSWFWLARILYLHSRLRSRVNGLLLRTWYAFAINTIILVNEIVKYHWLITINSTNLLWSL